MEDTQNNNSQEIVLTEVIEPPRDQTFSSILQQAEPSINDAQEAHDSLSLSDSTVPQKVSDNQINSILQEVLSSDSSVDEAILFEQEPPLFSEEQQTPSSLTQEILQETLQNKEEPKESDIALNKLDNLDAMIDTMIASPSPDLLQTITLLTQRIEKLEQSKITEQPSSPMPSVIESENSIDERLLSVEGQCTHLHSTVGEIQNHLEHLLSIPKKINDIEKNIEHISAPEVHLKEEYSQTIQSIDSKIQSLQQAIAQTTESLSILSTLEKRYDELEQKLHSILIKTEEQPLSPPPPPSSVPTFEVTDITDKLQQLESTVEHILEKQQQLEQNTSLKVIHEALLPSIEKEAILAASRIIKEELQSILECK